jgi:hypothetical protein
VAEAKEVRNVLRETRVSQNPPPPLAYVFRVLFRTTYGLFRHLCCPNYGLTAEEMRRECQVGINVKRSLSTFMADGPYQFSDVRQGFGEDFRQRVQAEVDRICSGAGEDIVQEVMAWVHTVQLRALQEHAVCHPMQFIRAWTTTAHAHWEEQAQHWHVALRTREDHDLGWVPSGFTPAWNPGVAAVRLRIQETVEGIRETMSLEDRAHWEICAKDFSRDPYLRHPSEMGSTCEDTAMGGDGSLETKDVEVEDDTGLRTVEKNSDIGQHPVAEDAGNTVGVDVISLGNAGVPTIPDEGLARLSPCPTSPPANSPVTEDDKDRNVNEHGGPVFPEINSILANEAHDSPPADAVITLSQFENIVHSGVDMNLEGASFSQDPSFVHWVKGGVDDPLQTPTRGVSIVTAQDTTYVEVADNANTCRNLRDKFEQVEELEAVTHLVSLSHGTNHDVRVTSKPLVHENTSPTPGDITAAVSSEPWSNCSILQVGYVGVMTLAQAYNHLHVEDHLLRLPGRQGRRDNAREVIFFNEKGKEIGVKFSTIRDLKLVRTRLGNDIVDFVMSRLYFQYPARTRHEIQFLLSRVSACFQTMVLGKTSLHKWASVFLQPSPPVQIHQVKEILLPWVTDDHWSLLIFQYDKVIHMDSAQGMRHHPCGVHHDLIKWVSYAWQCFRGVETYDVAVVQQDVCQQSGNYECGHHTLRNALMYLKVMRIVTCLRL